MLFKHATTAGCVPEVELGRFNFGAILAVLDQVLDFLSDYMVAVRCSQGYSVIGGLLAKLFGRQALSQTFLGHLVLRNPCLGFLANVQGIRRCDVLG